MIILAHRANVQGSQPSAENSLAATQRALELGFGLETDLCRDPCGKFYIAHDPRPWTAENDFGHSRASCTARDQWAGNIKDGFGRKSLQFKCY